MRYLALVISLFISVTAYADTCGTSLMPTFTANQATQLCKVFGSAVNHSLIPSADDTYDLGSASYRWRTIYTPLLTATGGLVVKVDNDAQRLVTFDASSDTAITQTFGDGGTTAVQAYTLSASTADADDDSTLNFSGGGAIGSSGSRGGHLVLKGNEASGAGDAQLIAGDASGSDVTIFAWATDGRVLLGANGSNRWMIESDGDLAAQATGGDINMVTNKTLALQEATAGTACSGTLTANGATPVVTSTTCATTGSRIFLTRTSAETGVVSAWISALTNATSFAITGEAGDTGTYNWIIFHESP